MIAALRRRYLDILGSIYIFNEHRGYSSLDRVLEAVRRRYPEATEFIAAVEKHRADEQGGGERMFLGRESVSVGVVRLEARTPPFVLAGAH